MKQSKYFRQYYLKNKEKILKKNRKWAKDNPMILKAYNKRRYERNPNYWHQYYINNKDKYGGQNGNKIKSKRTTKS